MKLRVLALFLAAFITPLFAAPADADSAWQELSKLAKPPAPPAEWNEKRPSPEQMREWQKSLIPLTEDVAAKAKKFHETYPNHAKAEEARAMEKRFAMQASTLKRAGEAPKADDPAKADPGYKTAYDEAVKKIRARQSEGKEAFAEELEKQARELIKNFPDESEPWNMLLAAAGYSEGAKAGELFKEIESNAKDSKIKERAAIQMRKLNAVGKPFPLAFTAFDGRKVDISDLKGKVVLIDFWATWCGPCVAELPNVKAAYKELNPKGFEIIGISLDNEKQALERFVAKHEMTWPQYFDGQGWKTKIAVEHGINSIPAMYLIDKKGVLRDMNARADLEKKVQNLLAE